MAGRRRRGSRSNGPYRFTNNRRAALRRAQMISAKKRKRRAAITVGILAGGAAAAVLGATYGPKAKDGVAKQVASFKPRMADMRNKMAGIIAVDEVVKNKTREKHALSKPAKKGKKRRTPTATNPNPRTVKVIPQADPQAIRDAMKEEEGKNTLGGNAAKRQAERGYNDDLAQTIKDGPVQGVEKALRGKKGAKSVLEKTYRRNLGKQIKSLVEAGGTHPGRAYIDQLVAEAYVRGEIIGTPSTRRRRSNRRPRGSTASRGNSGRVTRRTLKSPGDFTEAEHQAATGMEY